MNKDDIIRMAREAGLYSGSPRTPSTGRMIEKRLEHFAALVAAAERNRTWTQEHWTEYERSIAAAERKRLHDKFMEIHKSQQHNNNYWHFAARKIMEEPDAA
jgi:hypothetical protein